MSKARVYGEVKKHMAAADRARGRRKAVKKVCHIIDGKLPQTPEGDAARQIVDAVERSFGRQLRPDWMRQVDESFRNR